MNESEWNNLRDKQLQSVNHCLLTKAELRKQFEFQTMPLPMKDSIKSDEIYPCI